MGNLVVSSPLEGKDDPSSFGRRLAHDLENDLAAIRIRSDVVLQSLAPQVAQENPLLAGDIEQIRDAAQKASEKVRTLARWITEEKFDENNNEREVFQ